MLIVGRAPTVAVVPSIAVDAHRLGIVTTAYGQRNNPAEPIASILALSSFVTSPDRHCLVVS